MSEPRSDMSHFSVIFWHCAEDNRKVRHVRVKTVKVVPEENKKVGHVRVKTAKVVPEDNRKLETSDIFETYPKVAEPAAEEETIDTVMPQADHKRRMIEPINSNSLGKHAAI